MPSCEYAPASPPTLVLRANPGRPFKVCKIVYPSLVKSSQTPCFFTSLFALDSKASLNIFLAPFWAGVDKANLPTPAAAPKATPPVAAPNSAKLILAIAEGKNSPVLIAN